ncbi:MAG: ABC transporter ATP-binding protein [Bacillota bacterium]
MAVILDKISKSFGDEKVLSDFSVELPDSGCVCFFGPSGSGKTTLFNILAGIVLPDSGSVTFTDNQKVSFAFQEDRLLPWISASDNVEQVIGGNDAHERAVDWLKRVGLTESAEKLPCELSGGMRQRVALARALAYNGDVLLLDEPFRGIDAQAKETLFTLLEKEKLNRLLVLVTHYPEEALRLADTVHVITGPPVQITDTIELIDEKRNDADFMVSARARLGTHPYSSEE